MSGAYLASDLPKHIHTELPWDIFRALGELDPSLTTFLILSPTNVYIPSSMQQACAKLPPFGSRCDGSWAFKDTRPHLFHVQPCKKGRQTKDWDAMRYVTVTVSSPGSTEEGHRALPDFEDFLEDKQELARLFR